MTSRSASYQAMTRLAATLAAAGFLFAAPASAQTRLPPPVQVGGADARQDRIEELQSQLTEATAENERLQYELNQRDREIARLRGMVGELAGVNQQLSSPPADGATQGGGATPPTTQQRSDAGPAPAGLNNAQQSVTGTLGTIPAGAATPGPAPAAPAPTADELYAQAQGYLSAGRLPDAELAFGDFLERYPNVVQTPNARYWYAFTLLARNNYAQAAQSFAQYLQRTPQGPRAPDAQVRLGMALAGMARDGNNDAAELRQACGAFSSLTTRYPNATREVRDRAVREARAANCPA